jgi:hypothetical protein
MSSSKWIKEDGHQGMGRVLSRSRKISWKFEGIREDSEKMRMPEDSAREKRVPRTFVELSYR